MKAIQKDFWREIRYTRSRFLSILILVALAVAFLSGLRCTAPDMKNTCDSYLDQQNFMDIQVLSTLGLTEEDLEVLLDQPGVSGGEIGWTVDAYAQTPDLDIVAKVHSLPQELNTITLTDGRMPRAADECVAEERLLELLNLEIGDQLTLSTSGDYADALAVDTVTVVGVVISPLYISVERGTSTLGTGQVAAYLYLPRSAFAMDYYTALYLTVEGAAETTAFSEEYDDLVDGVVDALEPLGEERAKLRRESLVDEATEKLDDAQAELDDAKAEAEQELADAETELADARAELDDGWAEYYDGLDTFRREIADAEQELSDGEQELTDALTELADGEAEYADGYQEYLDGLAEYEDGLAEYEENKKKVEDGWDEYNDGLAEYRAGERQLDDAYGKLQSGEAQYASGKQQLDGFVTSFVLPGSGYASADALSQALLAESSGTGSAHQAVEAALARISALKTLAENLETLEASQAQLTGAIGQLDAQIEALKQQIADLEAQEGAGGSGEEGGSGQEGGSGEEGGSDQEGETAQMLSMALLHASAELDALRAQLAQLQGQRDGLQDQLDKVNTNLAAIDAAIAAQMGPDATRDDVKAAYAQIAAAGDQIPASAEAVRSSYALLASSRAQLDSGWWDYRAGLAELNDAWKQLQEAKAELDDAEDQLADGKKELADAKAELADAQAELADGRQELDDGWAEYYDGLQELEDGKVTLEAERADGQRELDDALAELRDGEAEYADGYQEYLDGKAEAEEKITDAENELADARRKIADIGSSEWYILSRDSNPGYLGFGQDADRMGNLASVFPVLFFLVAALVCLTTMTRMVDDQRVQIGCLKALGYTRWTISRKYLGYGLLPALIGGALGLAIGFTLFPSMIFTAYQIMYDVPDIELTFYPGISAAAVGAAAACTTVSTLAACLASLADTPASLMRPRAPKAGKRVLLEYIRPLWRRMSFNHKVTARNLLRYQKRFWMTVIGIGGCTSLIIAGFGIRASLLSTMSRQYEEIYHYTAQVAVADNLLDTEREAIEGYLSGSGDVVDALPCYLTSVTAETDTYSTTAYLEAADPGRIGDFVTLRTMDGEPLTVPEDGAVIDQKLSELLDVGPGDSITVDGDTRAEVTVAAVTEHYLGHFIYLSPAYYEEVFGEDYRETAYLLTLTGSGQALCDAVFADLMSLQGVQSATRMETTRDTYLSSMERIDFVVVIVILSAAALAMVVLYNLSNINITERKRELATIRVLGFYDREVSAYVNRENVVLTAVGIVLGCVLGHFLHVWLVKSVEIDLMMFGRDTDPTAYVWAALLTALFSAAVSLLAHRKMKGIDMVESLKSAE